MLTQDISRVVVIDGQVFETDSREGMPMESVIHHSVHQKFVSRNNQTGAKRLLLSLKVLLRRSFHMRTAVCIHPSPLSTQALRLQAALNALVQTILRSPLTQQQTMRYLQQFVAGGRPSILEWPEESAAPSMAAVVRQALRTVSVHKLPELVLRLEAVQIDAAYAPAQQLVNCLLHEAKALVSDAALPVKMLYGNTP